VREIVETQIGANWAISNAHGVDLRQALIPPQKTKIIESIFRKGKYRDRINDVWLVLTENQRSEGGYGIVFREEPQAFGLVHKDPGNDEPFVHCGWYANFISAFQGM